MPAIMASEKLTRMSSNGTQSTALNWIWTRRRNNDLWSQPKNILVVTRHHTYATVVKQLKISSRKIIGSGVPNWNISLSNKNEVTVFLHSDDSTSRLCPGFPYLLSRVL